MKKFKQCAALIENKDVKNCNCLGLGCYNRKDDMKDYYIRIKIAKCHGAAIRSFDNRPWINKPVF